MSIFSSIPADSKIASNDLAFAIRDKYPVTDGHSLVIPNREFATWWEATPDERTALFSLVDEVRGMQGEKVSAPSRGDREPLGTCPKCG